MTNEQAKIIISKASIYAKRIGWRSLADDFSQNCLLQLLENPARKSTIRQMWIDYLRLSFGDIRTKKRQARGGFITLNSYHGKTPCYEDLINENYLVMEYADLFSGESRLLFLKLFTEDITQVQISKELGICQEDISIAKKKMIRRIKKFIKYNS